jgi:hypothetical protein
MTAVLESTASATPDLTNRADRALLPLVLSAAVLALAIPWQLRWGIVPDVSWIITVCERLLAGETLYIDLIEVNPPFTIWMFMPAVVLAHALRLAPEFVVHAYAYTICVLSLGFATLLARRANFEENARLAPLLPAFLALLVILPGNSFAQREQLGIALFLPLLVLMTWRFSPKTEHAPGLAVSLLAGLCGSVLVLVKPYYALMVLVPALYVAWQRRSVRLLFSIEYWVIGAVCILYLSAVVRFHPEFLRDVYPVLADTYMRIRVLPNLLVEYGAGYIIALFLLLRFLRPGVALPPLAAILTVASVAGILPLLYQGKGWAYHAYPAISLITAALLIRAIQDGAPKVLAESPALDRGRKFLLVVTIFANASPFLTSQKLGAEFVSKIKAATITKPVVAMIGSDLPVGHPLVRMLGGRWTSAYCSDWLGAFATYLGLRESGDMAAAAHYEAMVERYLDAKYAELQRVKPDVLIVQKLDALWVNRVFQREAFVRFMQDYRPLTEDPRMRVYILDKATAAASPAAASD